MNISERIKQIRKGNKLSQTAFGEKLGVSRDAINNAENNRVVPSELFIQHLCSVFSVNEEWLRTGSGEMFKQESGAAVDDKFEALAAEYGLTDLQVELIRTILKFPDNTQKSVVQFICDLADAVSGDDPTIIGNGSDDAEIDAEVENYRKELLLEKRAEERSLASGDTNA